MSAANNKIVIIFSGYNNRAVVSFIRTLDNNDVRYAVIARDVDDPIFKTAYKDNVVLTRESQSLDLEQVSKHIEIIKSKYKASQYLIAPSTEALNRFLQKGRTALEAMNLTVPLSDAGVYVDVSDKKMFGEICRENGIAVPGEYGSITSTNYPFVAKPKKYFAQDGSIHTPFLIFVNEQKESFLDECNPDDFYFQKYVEGKSIYLLYYFRRDGRVYKFSQENLIQQPNGGSILAAISSDFHNTSESRKYEQLFSKLGFHGLVMVELKVNDDKCYMIEANPRFWGPSQLFVDAGMNLFEAFLHDYGFVVDAPVFRNPSPTKYFWLGGMINTFRDTRELSFHKGCEEELLMSLDAWIQHDVYKRADTIGVFGEEIK
jgi:predicted ATP-grasp superfamily ATP-dependent carboligase